MQDIENTVVSVTNNKPILIKDIANVSLGPETRRGILDKGGAEVVGGVIVARYGSNPLEVIDNVKAKIKEIVKNIHNRPILLQDIIELYRRKSKIFEINRNVKHDGYLSSIEKDEQYFKSKNKERT